MKGLSLFLRVFGDRTLPMEDQARRILSGKAAEPKPIRRFTSGGGSESARPNSVLPFQEDQ
ncbi:hypothetical protein DDZ16_03670 [Marinilabilia rubra]|uniref:Uncharacterized protein n=1 Tax=Marinilabilia rubra TaxID=2162893 RepID=A0A2U2BCA8_9BACT|nr:hypothetical protein DDZ16_03670 [Marinilabilia rubra]